MAYFFRNLSLSIAIFCTASIGSVYGNFDNYAFGCGEIGDCGYCEPVSCGVCAPCGHGFIGAEVLYWRAFENGLDICIPRDVNDVVTSQGIVTSRFSGKSRSPHFDWNPGFRIGAGYEFACSNWDIGAFWTHYYSNTHGSRNNGTKLNWKLEFDVIDILAGYNYCLNSCVTLRPFGGLRGAQINQKLHHHERVLSTGSPIGSNRTSNKEDFSGIGPLFGLEAIIKLRRSFSFYASASIACLYGDFDVHFRDSNTSGGMSSFCKVKKHLDASLAAADAAIGIRWNTCICKNNRLFLQLGLEHHRYFDYNRLGEYGDLSFDGVSFGAGFEF